MRAYGVRRNLSDRRMLLAFDDTVFPGIAMLPNLTDKFEIPEEVAHLDGAAMLRAHDVPLIDADIERFGAALREAMRG
jgi:hypothetical protein